MNFCPNCGAQVAEGANFCTSCGKPLNLQTNEPVVQTAAGNNAAKRIIKIYGYKEWYAITPEVSVFLNNQFIGKVPYNGCLPVELTDDNAYFEFRLKASIGFPRTCHCFVNKTFTGGLQLKTNRLIGTISVDYVM